tara:strand:- start:5816 stop:6193 length:378 start_codon:yes stop_codon:yes gene_type:complete
MDKLYQILNEGGPVAWLLIFHAWAISLQILMLILVSASETYVKMKERIQQIRVWIACAPLLGLLGTVLGMQTIFSGLTQTNGKDELSKGIAEAFLTTEMGLMIAAPALLILISIEHYMCSQHKAR